jgi:hypothetical protein
VAVLTGLSGVEVPAASAIMTAVDPERFTIVDFRALWSLGIERMTYLPRISGGLPADRGRCGHRSAQARPGAVAILEKESAAGQLTRRTRFGG